jgi:hypothetical protein
MLFLLLRRRADVSVAFASGSNVDNPIGRPMAHVRARGVQSADKIGTMNYPGMPSGLRDRLGAALRMTAGIPPPTPQGSPGFGRISTDDARQLARRTDGVPPSPALRTKLMHSAVDFTVPADLPSTP